MKFKPRERIIRLLLRILANPYTYSKRELAEYFNVSLDGIKEDINLIKNAGIHVDQEKGKKYRYAILPEEGFKELTYLQPLDDVDKGKISRALYQFSSEKDARYLTRKLETLYDFQRLGLRALRRNALDRIDRLKAAKKIKRQVILEKYRSNNSGKITNRKVEPFLVDVEHATLQAYEIESKKVKHFLLPRIERVHITEDVWQFENKHIVKPTDVFRIANPNQIRVHLKIKTQAYNYLTEHYPKALSEIYPASEVDTWDFETNVNADFYGLSNFIMANSEHVGIVYPLSLKAHIKNKAIVLLERIE